MESVAAIEMLRGHHELTITILLNVGEEIIHVFYEVSATMLPLLDV